MGNVVQSEIDSVVAQDFDFIIRGDNQIFVWRENSAGKGTKTRSGKKISAYVTKKGFGKLVI